MKFSKRMKVAGTFLKNRRQAIEKYVHYGSSFLLQREPDNEYDDNAIKVLLKTSNGGTLDIGYIPAKHAIDLAPAMDAGNKFDAKFAMKIINENTGKFVGLVINVKDREVSDE